MAKQEKEKKIQFFSEDTQLLYQLYGSPATLKISGVPMHRHIRMNPLQDTETKIKVADPKGRVLDTCMGLGYTSIFSARKPEVKEVLVFERDPNVIEIAKLNPDSKEFFENKKIKLTNADVSEEIESLPSESFDIIIHDPPTFAISPDLYTLKFHGQLFRILKKQGRLWHYCPEPGKMSKKGSKLKERVMKQLKQVGFAKVNYDSASSGIIAIKEF